MKKGMGIGVVLLIGLVLWLVLRKPTGARPARQALAGGSQPVLLPGATYPSYPSEYELLHTTVPITRVVEKEIPVFTSIEEWREAEYG